MAKVSSRCLHYLLAARTKEVLQHGGSILGSVILCGTFRQISQLWDNAHTLNLENCLLHLSSTISHFFYFIRRIVFEYIFYCVTVHTLYYTNHGFLTNIIAQNAKSCSKQKKLLDYARSCQILPSNLYYIVQAEFFEFNCFFDR